ncbi:hypothetical protein C0992_008908, partial [Termitomyces sp. T32_za158]
MLSIAESQLADVQLTDTDKPGFRRFIKRVPLGVVFVIAPWKYVSLPYPMIFLQSHLPSFPYLTSINSVLPAIIAGNSVLLKPSPQTPVTAERIVNALIKAGLPKDVVQ